MRLSWCCKEGRNEIYFTQGQCLRPQRTADEHVPGLVFPRGPVVGEPECIPVDTKYGRLSARPNVVVNQWWVK